MVSRAAPGILVTGFHTSDEYKFKSIRVAVGRRFPENICNLKLSESFNDQRNP